MFSRFDIITVCVGTLPCLTMDGKVLLETKSRVAVVPDSNGGVYGVLRRSANTFLTE
jgi:UDP-N-acetylglucosamine/UDP-N-acetylgalactosamine diphosphorylase